MQSKIEPGDLILIKFVIPKGDTSATQPDSYTDITAPVRVAVVADPVTPAPHAAYALLRRDDPAKVRCARFAWSPAAARIDLVSPDDLATDVVRRRALFIWTDTIRTREGEPDYQYAIQKIAQTGATSDPWRPQ